MTCINWIRKQISSIELTYANHEKKMQNRKIKIDNRKKQDCYTLKND